MSEVTTNVIFAERPSLPMVLGGIMVSVWGAGAGFKMTLHLKPSYDSLCTCMHTFGNHREGQYPIPSLNILPKSKRGCLFVNNENYCDCKRFEMKVEADSEL